MQIPEMTEELYSALHDIWDSNAMRLPDEMRDPDLLDYFLFQDAGATKLYLVEPSPTLIMVGDIKEGLSATVILLNHEHAEVGQILREMRGIIDEFRLKRLTAQVPGPVKDVQKTLERVGFRREGHMRRSTVWNSRLVGIDIWGMYKDPAFESRRANGREAHARQSSRSQSAPEVPAAQEVSAA